MKKKFFLLASLFLTLPLLAGCENESNSTVNALTFSQDEYSIHSGDIVKVEQTNSNIKYTFAGYVPKDVVLDEKTGKITFSQQTPNKSQVILVAEMEDMQSDQAVVTLLQNNVETTLEFILPIKNICDRDYVVATSSNNTGIAYSLKNPVKGVEIDSMSGLVSYTSAAEEGVAFTVVASSVGQSIEETYYVAKNHLVTSSSPAQAVEKGSTVPATYELDFSDIVAPYTAEVVTLMNGNKFAKATDYEFVGTTLVVKTEYIETFKEGENTLKIITPRNIVNVDLIRVTKYIRTVEDLQGINKNPETLSGYYVLENDLDMTEYLTKGHPGYNDARGWNQIGIYHDLENEPLRDSFTGTFDGNGHVIRGFFEERADDLAHTEGLFGYLSPSGIVRNVGFIGDPDHKTTGRNIIGGLIGYSEGLVENCWANVNISNKHEDQIFNSVGGFIGGNTGIIRNCYSYGKPEGDKYYGAFIGRNYGTVENCYGVIDNDTNGKHPFCGYLDKGGVLTNCEAFTSVDALKAVDFASTFDADLWDFSTPLPTLKHHIDIENANGIQITNFSTDAYAGQNLTLNIDIHPKAIQSAYINEVEYTINPEGSGITRTGNVLNLNNVTVGEFTVVAKLVTQYGTFSDAKTFKVYPKIDSINFVDDMPSLIEPGKQYALNAAITPANAPQEVTWSIKESKPSRIITINGNIMTVPEEIMNYKLTSSDRYFTVVGTAQDGKTIEKELYLRKIYYLGDTYTPKLGTEDITQSIQNIYLDTFPEGTDEKDKVIEFTLPANADMTNLKVYRYNSELKSSAFKKFSSTHKVQIKLDQITEIPDREIPFTFRSGDSSSLKVYRGYACYISHNRYTMDDVPQQYIALGNAQAFYNYFLMRKSDTDLSKFNNNDKTYVLTGDIDFEGATNLVGIGYSSSSYDQAKPFSGTIYGFNHKIRNATFGYTARYYFEGEDPEGKYGNKNNVGVFPFFSGKMYDVIFENVNVNGHANGACFAGRMLSGSYIENVIFINCDTRDEYNEDHKSSDINWARVCCRCSGLMLGVSYNGTLVGLVGQ